MLNVIVLGASLTAGEIPPDVAAQGRAMGERIVRVSFWFGRDEEGIPGEDKTSREEAADRLYERNMSLRWYGIAVDENGSVLCADPCIPLRRVVKIEGAYPGGQTAELAIGEVFVDYHALRLRRTENPASPVPYVKFSEPSFAFGDPFYRVEVVLVSRETSRGVFRSTRRAWARFRGARSSLRRRTTPARNRHARSTCQVVFLVSS